VLLQEARQRPAKPVFGEAARAAMAMRAIGCKQLRTRFALVEIIRLSCRSTARQARAAVKRAGHPARGVFERAGSGFSRETELRGVGLNQRCDIGSGRVR
jgi:hypothetical protein